MNSRTPLNLPARWAAKALTLPQWLEPRLRTMGSAVWSRIERADARASLRWLVFNWPKVSAWWITIGVVLSVLLLLGALIASRNPQAFAYTALAWSGRVLGGSTLFAGKLSALVFVLSLPITLPMAVLVLMVLLTVLLAAIIFGPVAVVVGGGLSVLFAIAFTRRFGGWLAKFVIDGLTKADHETSLINTASAALGLAGSSSGIGGQTRPLGGEELERFEAENRKLEKGGRLLLGMVNGKQFFHTTEKHVFITAPARAGKGRDLIIPNLNLYPHSVFVLDPKGENCTATAAKRRAMGHTIAAFDPYGTTREKSVTFDPIAAILRGGTDTANLVTGADYLAEALVIGKDDHWTESARSVVRAFVLHLATVGDDVLEGRPRDLATLRELVRDTFDATLEKMAESEALDGLVAGLSESIAAIPDDERGSILSTVQRSTKWLDNPALASMFKAAPDSLDFNMLRDESQKLSVFVCLPAMVFTTYPQVCRLLTTFALDTMMRKLTGRKRPVMFILDELAQLAHLPIVERSFTLGAGYGVQVWAVFQSIGQAAKLYAIDALYGSSGIRAFFSVGDPETCEYASKCASGLLDASQVRRLPSEVMLTLLDGANPLILGRVNAVRKT